MKSWPSPPIEDVVAGAGVDGVVAGAALEHVGAVEVGDDVVAVATEGDVVAAVALDDVVAGATPEGVVVVAAEDPVDAGGAVVDRLAVDAGRVDGVERPVLDRAVGLAQQQQALVAVRRRRVVGDDEAVQRVNPAAVPSRLASWNLQSAVANASAFSELVPSVLRWISSENELPSSWVRRFMPGVRAR